MAASVVATCARQRAQGARCEWIRAVVAGDGQPILWVRGEAKSTLEAQLKLSFFLSFLLACLAVVCVVPRACVAEHPHLRSACVHFLCHLRRCTPASEWCPQVVGVWRWLAPRFWLLQARLALWRRRAYSLVEAPRHSPRGWLCCWSQFRTWRCLVRARWWCARTNGAGHVSRNAVPRVCVSAGVTEAEHSPYPPVRGWLSALLLHAMSMRTQSTVWYGRMLAIGMLFAAVGGMLAQVQKPLPAMCALFAMQVCCPRCTAYARRSRV